MFSILLIGSILETFPNPTSGIHKAQLTCAQPLLFLERKVNEVKVIACFSFQVIKINVKEIKLPVVIRLKILNFPLVYNKFTILCCIAFISFLIQRERGLFLMQNDS